MSAEHRLDRQANEPSLAMSFVVLFVVLAAMVAIVPRQAATKTKVVAIWMIITTALLGYGYRSVAMSAALVMSPESRDNTGCPNLSGLP